MKKLAMLLLALALACSAALADGAWYCPQCGALNDSNYCPNDGTPRPEDFGQNGGYTQYAWQPAMLNQRLATRTGPGTWYDEPGSFFQAGAWITVLSKAYDTSNGIWWLQVEFTSGGAAYRAYTGLKRVDGLNIAAIPEETAIGRCTTPASALTGYYGPGYDYKEIKRKLPANVSCTIYGYAYGPSSDFIQIEMYDSGLGKTRRAWVPDWSVNDLVIW